MSEFIFWSCLVLFIIILYRNNFSKGIIIFDNILFFSAGFIYYWIIPYFYFIINKKVTHTAFIDLTQYTKNLQEENKILFLLFCYISYFLFVYVAKYTRKIVKTKSLHFGRSFLLYDIATIPFCILAFYYLFRMRSSFMGGYIVDYNIMERGPLITLSLFIFIIAIIKSKYINFYKNWQMILYWFIAFFVLTLGTRLYFLSSLVTIIAIYYTNKKSIKTNTFFIYVFLISIVFSIIGILRQKDSLTLNMISFIFLAEPLYTSYSLFSFLKFNDLPLLNLPYGIFIDFVNLIPTILFPEKLDLMKTLYISEYNYVSPMGAKNIFVSLMENFGILGSFIFISLFSFITTYLSKKMPYSYFILLGMICFSFFRDPFSVSIIKYLIQIALIAPIYYYCVIRFLKTSVKL